MVEVNVTKKDNKLVCVHISGHANADKYGKDLVCAGVSSIAIGLANAIDQLTNDNCKIDVEENIVSIIVLKNSETIQTILQTGIIQLKTIEEEFPNNIKINITEV